MGAFQLHHRGISGTLRQGADAIIVSGKREGVDTVDRLMYVAEWRIGANAMWKSYVEEKEIRVFRSAQYERQIEKYSDIWEQATKISTMKPMYRYGK